MDSSLGKIKENLLKFKSNSRNQIQLIFVCDKEDKIKSKADLNIFNSEEDITLIFGGDSIYDAMNKGLKIALGDFYYFAGDTDLINYKSLLESILLFKTKKIIFGKVIQNSKIIQSKFASLNPYINIFFERNTSHHQGILYHKDVFKDFGFYKKKYSVLADMELNYRLSRCEKIRKYSVNSNLLFANLDLPGRSGNRKLENYLQAYKIKSKYLSFYLKPICFIVEIIIWIIQNIRKFLFCKLITL